MSLKLKIVFAVFIALAGFLVVRIGFIFNNTLQQSKKISETARLSAASPDAASLFENFLVKDTDGDGMPDRDEIIFGTDPDSKDTDGDGYWDGEEIASGHDPLDSSSTDEIGGTNLSFLSASPNLTNRLFNLGLANLVDNSGNLDPARVTPRKLADIVVSINNEASLYFALQPLEDSDIKISDDNSVQSVRKYILAATPLLEESLFSFAPFGAGGLSVERMSNYYLSVSSGLKELTVPSSWKELHKSALLELGNLSSFFLALTDQAIEEDPIKASFALGQVQDTFFRLNGLLNQAASLAKSQNVPVNDSVIQSIQTLTP